MTDVEIVRTLAEKCMGWTDGKLRRGLGGRVRFPSTNVAAIYIDHANGTSSAWNPLTSIADAFAVVEKMRELGFDVLMGADKLPRPDWAVNFKRGDVIIGDDAETVSRAICLAAIAALEGK